MNLSLQTTANRPLVMSLTLFSPAKINLNFKLIGKREDGYHLIESDMIAINLFDILKIEPHFTNALEGTNPLPFNFADSIFQKGYLLLKKRFKDLPFIRIILDKKIPIGAGLGGGSSNLATFLWGMNELFRLDLSLEDLAIMGAKVGADVPFFSCGSAFVHGIGTDVVNLTPLQTKQFTLFFIDEMVSTPLVYGAVDMAQVDAKARNQLEKFALKVYPCYQKKIELIKQTFPKSFMSGSGSTFVAEGYHFVPMGISPYFHAKSVLRQTSTWYQNT